MAGVSAKIKLVGAILFLLGVCICPHAYSSWDKKTANGIVAAALSSLPGETGAFLKENSSFFRQGLRADSGTVNQYAGFTSFDTTGYAAGKLGDQITLLRDLFPKQRSPYMAYRLGILTKLILNLNSPLATTAAARDVSVRDKFMKDVETDRSGLRYVARPPRRIRNPETYVKTAIERSAGWAGPVRSQYLRGKGYNVIVQRAASRFYNEAAHSVLDILYTICSGGGGKVDNAGSYEFYRDACEFYLGRGMKQEALGAYRRVGGIASSLKAERIDSLEDAVERYELILQVGFLEDRLRAAGIEVREPVGEKMLGPFLSAISRLAKMYVDSGQEDKARTTLSMCLREKHLPDWTLHNLRKLYGLDKLKNLDVPENAWQIYREANRFESVAGRAHDEGRQWAANDSLVRAATLYSAIPGRARELRRASLARIDQIRKRMQEIPPAALLSEELFQSAVDSIAEGDIDSAVRGLHLSRQWGPGDKAVDRAIADTESLKLFMKGRDLYREEDYEAGVNCFRKLTKRFPGSRFAGQAKEMIALYEKRKDLEAGRLLLLLKGAYEASFVGDEDTVYELNDEILKSHPGEDLRDRARLLIAVAWYQANQKGYSKIDRVLRDLLKHNVLKEDGNKLVLKKKIDFYFGLKDPFPDIEFSELDDALLARLGLKGEAPKLSEAEDAEETIEDARDEIKSAEELISRGESEGRDMRDAQSLLDEANDQLGDAMDRFEEGAYKEAKESATRALEKATAAKEEAGEMLGEAEDLKKEAEGSIDDAETAVSEAESAVEEAEQERDMEFDQLRSDHDKAMDLLNEARSLFDDGEYEQARDKASEAVDKAEEVTKDAEELRDKEEEEAEGGGEE